MTIVVVIAGIVIGLLLAIAVGVKRCREHNAEVRHYEDRKNRPPP